ncbi:MAG: hypothetical protein IT203_11065 [Fimbriimonadaceae bacterium]|nr:hypothetical protein [Fimbriimonadaceae bacterium]
MAGDSGPSGVDRLAVESLAGQRILVYGVTGSGKTTFARELSEAIEIPWHSVDDLTWNPGWQEVPIEEQRRRIADICEGDRWILDTAYGKWLDIPLANADLILALDYPRWFSLLRLTRRTLIRLVDGKPICNGNRETLHTFFSRESILLWHFKSFSAKRERIAKWVEEGRKVVRFRRAREAASWLRSLP